MHIRLQFLIALAFFSTCSSVWGALEPNFLRVALESEPVTLDWNRIRSGSDRFIVSFLMRGLLKYDASSALICDLCKSYSVSPDRRILTFQINTDEVWSDKVPLEAQQFVDSFRRLLDPSLNSPAADEFRIVSGAPPITHDVKAKKWDASKLGVRASGKETLEITLTRPLAIFPHLLTTVGSFPIRKELLSGKDAGEKHATLAVIGPYFLAEWVHGKRIVLEGNEQFKGSRPVHRVDFALGSHAQLAERFKKGRLDLLSHPTTEDLLKIRERNVQVNPFLATRNLLLNVKGPLADASLRRAVLYSLDRATLPAFLKTGERPITGLIPKGLPGYRELPLATVDLPRAQAERSRAKASSVLTLKLLITNTPSDKKVAEWLARQLLRIQIKTIETALPKKEYLKALGHGQFDLALNTWSFGIASPLELLHEFQTGAPGNFGNWTNVAFDALVDQLFRDPKEGEFATLLDQSSQMIEIQDIGVIPLGYPTQSFLLSGRVRNFATTPFGDPDLVKIALKPSGGKAAPPARK
ncbi:MAG: hypothetical protein A2Z97_02850 [Bdellovibrionales bacterium GWB1_52_6]|nr:MAG: hypothetical protein A2Z97_02850 [Bdellovibrionales bacterium GWB1_52_6]OFZ05835.1 MAG: hypothetical protein A2X97_04000 [Bdellovibrionales bacterium GWA1_52_35]HCM40220.1 hypothetical protein [Bdellovibrionales bacterium]